MRFERAADVFFLFAENLRRLAVKNIIPARTRVETES